MRSRKLAIVFACIVGGLVLLAGGALLLVKVLVTPDMVRKHFLPRVEQAIHRRIEMADVKIGLFYGIALRGLKVYEPDGTAPFVSLGEARLRYQFLPLLSRRVVVDEILLVSPDVRVIRNTDGSFNFSDLMHREKTKTPKAVGEGEKTPFAFAVSRVNVSDGRVMYLDRKGISGVPFEYALREVGVDIKNLAPDQPFPLDVTAKAPGADLAFSGTVSGLAGEPAIDGQLALTADDLAKTVTGLPPGIAAKVSRLSPQGTLSAKLRLAGPMKEARALLKGGEVRLEKVRLLTGGLSPELAGSIDIVDGTLVSRDLVAVLGKDRLQVRIKTAPLNRKPFAAELSVDGDSLDIDALMPPKKAAQASAQSAAGGAAEPGPLKLPISLSGVVNLKKAVVKGLALSGVTLDYRLVDNILTINDIKGSTVGGSFLGNTRINLGTRGFSYSGTLSLQGAQADGIVAAFAPKSAGKISGTLSLKTDVAGSGTKAAAIKRNLSGSGSFEVRNGKVTGSGFAAELARFLGSEELRVVRFSSFAGTYRIKSGQVFLDSSLDGSDVRMKPKGRIGFDKSLDISLETRIAPRITGTVARGTVGSFLTDEQGWGVLPLKVTGTTGSPRFTLSGKAVGRRIGEKIGETIRKQLEQKEGADQEKSGPNLEETIRGFFGK